MTTEITVAVCDFCDAPLPDTPGGGRYVNHAACVACFQSLRTFAYRDGQEKHLTKCPPDEGLASWLKRVYW